MAAKYYYVAIIVCVVFLVALLAGFFLRHWLQKRRLGQKAAKRDREANEMVQRWQSVQEPQRAKPKYHHEPLTTYISSSTHSSKPSAGSWSYISYNSNTYSSSTYNNETLPSYSLSDGFARPYYYYKQDEGDAPAQKCHICQRQFNDTDAVKQAFGGLVHQQCYSFNN